MKHISKRKVNGEIMGYRSEVTIMCEDKAYEMFKEAWKRADLKPDHIYVSGDDGNYQYTLRWDWIKWYEGYDDVKEIIKVMNKLDEYEEQDGYAYKLIEIGEDNATEVRENEGAWYTFEDFRVVVDVNLPSDIKEIED